MHLQGRRHQHESGGGLTFTDKCSGNTTILTIQYTGLYSSIQWYGISWCQRRKTY